MVRVESPSVSGSKSPEQNIQAIKSSLNELIDAVNYLSARQDNVESRVDALESEEE